MVSQLIEKLTAYYEIEGPLKHLKTSRAILREMNPAHALKTPLLQDQFQYYTLHQQLDLLRAVNLDFLDPEPLLFHSSSSSIVLTRLSGPRSRPTTSQKIC
jgi:hypothetical protein